MGEKEELRDENLKIAIIAVKEEINRIGDLRKIIGCKRTLEYGRDLRRTKQFLEKERNLRRGDTI